MDSSQYAPIGYLPGAFGCPGRAPQNPSSAERSRSQAGNRQLDYSRVTSKHKTEDGDLTKASANQIDDVR